MSEQPRDEQGRFAATGGGRRDVRAWASRFAGPLAAKADREGGFTYRPGGAKGQGRQPTDGIMVSRHPDEKQGHVVEIAKMAEKAALRVMPNAEKLGGDHYLGGWFEKDDKGGAVALHLDVSQRFDPRHKDKAIKAGRERNQLAVWDLGKKEEIATGGTGR